MSGTDQPSVDQVYEAPGNPAEQQPAEQAAAKRTAQDKSSGQSRGPSEASANPTPSSQGQGSDGIPKGDEVYGKTQDEVGRHNELSAEQMAAPGEGNVADAVRRAPGGGGHGEPDQASGLEQKKRDQGRS